VRETEEAARRLEEERAQINAAQLELKVRSIDINLFFLSFIF
jgi:hypothetical protein